MNKDHQYRCALLFCFNRYSEMNEDEVLGEFIVECIQKTPSYPLNKLNRWLGYVQGCLISAGKTTVEEERNWTRPLFRPLDF